MKIYLSHSTNFDFKNELYKPLKEAFSHVDFTFPHENSAEPFNTKELFMSKSCNLVVADISLPSTGQGIELGWANLLNIPIVCIYKKNSKFSKSLKIISKDFIEYQDSNDLIHKLQNYLHVSN
jgi:hypothetical protein